MQTQSNMAINNQNPKHPTIQRINEKVLPTMLLGIGCEKGGIKIMQKKGEILCFVLRNLHLSVLNILKQELLSVGGDLATPKEAILFKQIPYTALIIATKSQLMRVIKKCKSQPFGLKTIASSLESHILATNNTYSPHIMPIINLTPDSFHKPSRKSPNQAIKRIEELIEKGATLIDIGAASSRPGSDIIGSSEEISRLKEVCMYIKQHNLCSLANFSIDTYNPKTATFALQCGFKIINDVSGLANNEMFSVIKDFNADVILMHSRGTPKTMATMIDYKNLFAEIDLFFEKKIERLRESNAGDIILDIGFGFAKTHNQNLALIQHLSHFKHFGLKILVGASNKSTIGEIIKQSDSAKRLSGTLSLHLVALMNGANILRVHDYEEHKDMLTMYEVLSKQSL